MANWADYRKKYQDVQDLITDFRQEGLGTGNLYASKFGQKIDGGAYVASDTSGWEKEWLKNLNNVYGRSNADAGQFTEDEIAKYHYDTWGKGEGRTWEGQGITEGQAANAKDDYFDVDKFDTLLNRLEGSKGRQQRQKSLENRRNISAQGLASMMGNF